MNCERKEKACIRKIAKPGVVKCRKRRKLELLWPKCAWHRNDYDDDKCRRTKSSSSNKKRQKNKNGDCGISSTYQLEQCFTLFRDTVHQSVQQQTCVATLADRIPKYSSLREPQDDLGHCYFRQKMQVLFGNSLASRTA